MNNEIINNKLIGQGAFGCIFYPKINCKNNNSTEQKQVSKILVKQKHKFKYPNKWHFDNLYLMFTFIQLLQDSNEPTIGKKIVDNIPDYSNFFIPALNSCEVKLTQIEKSNLNKCNVLKKVYDSGIQDNVELINIQMKYVDNAMTVHNFMTSDSISINKKFHMLFYKFNHILQGIQKLINQKIVHYDMKMDNVIIDMDTNTPLIIDFGISIDLTIPFFTHPMLLLESFRGNSKYKDLIFDVYCSFLRTHFYIYGPDYSFWSPEIHIINYFVSAFKITQTRYEMLKNGTKEINIDSFKNKFPNPFNIESFTSFMYPIITEIITKNIMMTSVLSTEFIESYISIYIEYLREIMIFGFDNTKTDVTPEDAVLMINNIIHKTYHTWDLYSISLQFMKYSKNLIQSNDFMYKILYKLYFSCIHPNPFLRPSPSLVIDYMYDIQLVSNIVLNVGQKQQIDMLTLSKTPSQ